MSTEWYTLLEKGHISGVAEDFLAAVAQALQLDENERTYLFDLARAARPARRRATGTSRPRPVSSGSSAPSRCPPPSYAMGRLDLVATNPLARALHAPMFDSPTTGRRGCANFAR
ncbi:hypothetical protein [Streptomyces sp. NPDC059278]|uniref:hypothetical protein n=1 Tax=Streptomyces sp. NPDC059278 TaxID=3346801 RepID=UPI00367B083C